MEVVDSDVAPVCGLSVSIVRENEEGGGEGEEAAARPPGPLLVAAVFAPLGGTRPSAAAAGPSARRPGAEPHAQ